MNKCTGITIFCHCDKCKKIRRDTSRIVMVAELMRDGKTAEEAVKLFDKVVEITKEREEDDS